eukprot:g4279.t1
MARFSAFAFLALFTSAATAFVTPLAGAQLGRRAVSANVATTRMSAAPATAAPTAEDLKKMAEACQEDGCSVETVSNLLDQLKAKKKELQLQLVTVDDVLEMMGDTSNLAEKGELEKLIEAVGRVFSTNDGSDYIPYPTGYSGEVNKEKKDAWDYNINTPLKPVKPAVGRDTAGGEHGNRQPTEMAKRWSVVDSSGSPTARSGHCVTVAKDEMYLFGGCGHPGKATQSERHSSAAEEALPICLGDLHVFNVAGQRWREIVVPAGKPRPAQRTCAAICASEEEDRLFLSGGAGDDPYDLRGDLLQFDVRERTWSVLYDDDGVKTGARSQSFPFRRIGHTMVHHSASNRLVLFGGSTGLEYFDDTHAFDLAAGSWTLLATVGERPSPRYKHQAFIDADFMYVIGGGSYEPEGPDLDVYRLALVADDASKPLKWERLTPAGNPPRCRAAHGLAWDPVGRAAYVWGGFTSGMELDSTFCALRLPPPPPRAASPPAAAATGAAIAAAVAAAVDVEKTVVAPTAAVAPLATCSTAVAPVSIRATGTEAAPAAASPLPPPPAAAAAVGTAAAAAEEVAVDVGEHREPGRSTEAAASSSSSRVAYGRNRRTLSADSAEVLAAAVAATAAAEAARENKPSGSASGISGEGRTRRASASGTELAEQQQWQEDPQHEQLQQPQVQPRLQIQPREQQEQLQQHSPPLSSEMAAARSSPGGESGGRDRWRRRGQRLWRQGSGAERGGDNDGRTRRTRGGRRRSWGQAWASGRFQGLWGGGGGGGGSGSGGANVVGAQGAHRASPPAPSPTAPLPPPPPPPAAAATPAAAVAEGEELSWVSLPSGQGSGAAGARGSGGEGTLPTSSPTGRSFHCAFFHGGACYVTGGSDGARKFGDLWRFPLRESPPPLTTLAARAFASKCRAAATSKAATGKSGGREEQVSHMELLLESLPQELRECLSNLNMQAEVVL